MLRNKVTKLNRQKKKQYYKSKFDECNVDSKKLWRTLNEVMGRSKNGKTPSFIEHNGILITRPYDIANYFNKYFLQKVNSIRDQLLPGCYRPSIANIRNLIMVNKDCGFEFKTLREIDVEKLLTIKCDKPCGLDNLDGKLLKLAAKVIAKPLCHIFNLCFKESIHPIYGRLQKSLLCQKTAESHLQGLW